MQKRTIFATAGIAAALVFAGTTGAVAGSLIGSAQIEDNSVRSIDVKDETLRVQDLRPGAVAKLQGQDGASGLTGAFYATAFYNAGNTNAGAIASVACDSDPTKTDYVAISGGAQVLGLDANANSRNTPVSSSFPGRMDWATNTPKPGRLDGWIVQFGGNAGTTSDKAPEKVKVWALCVPGADIPVEQTYSQS